MKDLYRNDGPDRLPPIASEHLTDAQRAAAAEFVGMRGTEVFGPFAAMLRSPELMLCSAAMGEYVRYRSALPPHLSELAILVVAQQWQQSYQWAVHAAIALQVGIHEDLVRAVAEGRRHDAMSDEEACVYDVLIELHRTRQVSDDTYARALAELGEQGIVDLLGIAGHYTLLSMVMNTARTPPPRTATTGGPS
jgi:4-carboxymuconolactone decarboxylase